MRKPRPRRRRREYTLHVMLDEYEMALVEKCRDFDRTTFRAIVLRALMEFAERHGIAKRKSA